MTTEEKESEIVGIIDDDLKKLFAVNPIALEQVKRIIGERVIGEQDSKIKLLEEELRKYNEQRSI